MRFVETEESRKRTAEKQHFVWRARGEKRGRYYAWRVESIEAAHAMVRWWREREPQEYPLSDEWVVTLGETGDEVARFTTKEVA